MVILYHCTIAVHLQYEDEENRGWNPKLWCLLFFSISLFGICSRGCSWTAMLMRTFGRTCACGWRLRCSQILACGCLLSHEGGGRIQQVFLTQGWLEMANVVTAYITRTSLVSDFAFSTLQTRQGRIHWIKFFSFFFFRQNYLLSYSPCALETAW